MSNIECLCRLVVFGAVGGVITILGVPLIVGVIFLYANAMTWAARLVLAGMTK